MLVTYLKDMSIAYDGINVVHEKKGTEKEVEYNLGKDLIRSGSVEETVKAIQTKKIDSYEDKSIKSYENKSPIRGRPRSK